MTTKTIDTIARELATIAVDQGVTAEMLASAGADLAQGDIDYAAQEMGRELTTREKTDLLSLFIEIAEELLDAKG